MAKAELRIEVLDDGKISITTDKIPGAHHVSADELLDFVTLKAGGTRETIKRRPSHVHAHTNQQIQGEVQG
jgi:hypothetical protein